ncbi:hypothetical protein F7731_10725 [Cytobacillus depressus]|uniref:Aldehyde dehydrogenase family protein n=1 Tax=Cytobacillus depressus TaxID=1602942 RepID=A0A6L3VCA1_9BACI|nr:hypothetical protein [Cytobacillus depressus]KAB2336813.1 hypothetical protein F7731_10725 [Cytobacillus depressus]
MLYINGEWINTDNQMDVINPATGEIIQTITVGGRAEKKRLLAQEQHSKLGKRQLGMNVVIT